MSGLAVGLILFALFLFGLFCLMRYVIWPAEDTMREMQARRKSAEEWERHYQYERGRAAAMGDKYDGPFDFNGPTTGSGGQVFVTDSGNPMLDGVRIGPSGYVAEFMKEEEK
jgi:hypothetical protein